MKKLKLSILALLSILLLQSCQPKKPESTAEVPASILNYSGDFPDKVILDQLLAGTLTFDSPEITQAKIRQLQYQRISKSGNMNGVVIPKNMLISAVNGFTVTTPNTVDSLVNNNYNKWDFMVVYPGLAINAGGDQRIEPAIFYYKGGIDSNGSFGPIGNPVANVKFPGGGGGDGVTPRPTPPPTPGQ